VKDISLKLDKATKDGVKKALVGGIANTTWIAKIVAKVNKMLETAEGDVGYSGDIPVALDAYRPKLGEKVPSKLLP
jgi:uncharacterized protein YhdP